jgi:selenobiotic family peptide radical SAM maturase
LSETVNLPQQDLCDSVFTRCRHILGAATWGRVCAAAKDGLAPEQIPAVLERLGHDSSRPAFLPDLARLELAFHQVCRSTSNGFSRKDRPDINPTLTLLPAGWQGLADLLLQDNGGEPASPVPGTCHLLLWRRPDDEKIHVREAEEIDLLALKVVAEGLSPEKAARAGHTSTGHIRRALYRGFSTGLLMPPISRVDRRHLSDLPCCDAPASLLSADWFTLQWHITQACDLRCRHCYDRSARSPMPLATALDVLDDFSRFCEEMRVTGQVTFTGGNPLLYPRFTELYQAAADHGFSLAILGNPAPAAQIETLLRIAPLSFYQVSLEGLAEHNDHIRGPGHFQRTMAFIDDLNRLGIYTMVMLTLTRDNQDQVLPLAEKLRGRVDHFTFNRLATVGEGAHLTMPDPESFGAFLQRYAEAARENPTLGLKDNLFNSVCDENGSPRFDGCTGYGCGAAFNFVALLPDGEVHACRKFPSLLGNMFSTPLADIYHSDLARRYRTGPQECRDCSLAPACRGCLAVSYSTGLDFFRQRDPFCRYPLQPATP